MLWVCILIQCLPCPYLEARHDEVYADETVGSADAAGSVETAALVMALRVLSVMSVTLGVGRIWKLPLLRRVLLLIPLRRI